MDSSSFNLEGKINEFLENFNQTANSAIEDELFSDGSLTRSRSKFMMDEGLEMTGNGGSLIQLHDIDLRCNKASLFSNPIRIALFVPLNSRVEEEECAILSN